MSDSSIPADLASKTTVGKEPVGSLFHKAGRLTYLILAIDDFLEWKPSHSDPWIYCGPPSHITGVAQDCFENQKDNLVLV